MRMLAAIALSTLVLLPAFAKERLSRFAPALNAKPGTVVEQAPPLHVGTTQVRIVRYEIDRPYGVHMGCALIVGDDQVVPFIGTGDMEASSCQSVEGVGVFDHAEERVLAVQTFTRTPNASGSGVSVFAFEAGGTPKEIVEGDLVGRIIDGGIETLDQLGRMMAAERD